MKTLVLNCDARQSGISSLGLPDVVEKYGFTILNIREWDVIKNFAVKFGKYEKETVQVAGIDTTVSKFKVNEPFNQFDMLVIDPIDAVFWMVKEHLLEGSLASNMSTWDKLTNASVKFLSWLGALPMPVIATCHDKGETKGDVDTISPFVQGTFKDQLGSFFDIILYTKVYKGANNKVDFKWQLLPDAIRPTRAPQSLFEYGNKVGGEMNQDFGELFEHIDFPNPKVLIIGSYGSGKTTSLKTIVNISKEKVNA